MNIETQVLQEKCKIIWDALGKILTDAQGKKKKKIMELTASSGNLRLAVADSSYYLSVNIPVESEESWHVAVQAPVFIPLVTKTTAKTMTLSVSNNVLRIKGNGSYTLASELNGVTCEPVTLTPITISNVTSEFYIKNSILQSILKYNAKIFSTSDKPGKYPFLYMDEKGAIALLNSACVNSFSLECPVSLFLTETLVKLFKLFKTDDVKFTMGFDSLANLMVQQKVCFSDGNVTLYAILTADPQTTDNFPASKIRDISESASPYTVIISKDELVGALGRIALFKHQDPLYESIIRLTFSVDGVTLEDYLQHNSETVYYSNPCEALAGQPEYSTVFNVNDIYLILDNCEDDYLTVSFGNRALYITKANITSIIPEGRVRGR